MNYFSVIMAVALYVLIWVLYFTRGISLDTTMIINMIFFMLFPVYVEYTIDDDEDE